MAEHCEGCGYLEDETFEYMLDDGSRIVQLCGECFERITGDGKE